jgi:antitoxin ParD1/3/4
VEWYRAVGFRGSLDAMTITLTPEQHAWIDAHIARGDFASVEDAARQLIDERIVERAAEEEIGDLAWAKPYLHEALADVAHGKVLTREEHEARMDAVLASMKA